LKLLEGLNAFFIGIGVMLFTSFMFSSWLDSNSSTCCNVVSSDDTISNYIA
jgi:hypothetical protein